MKKGGAFKLVFQAKYLLFIALLMMFPNWVNTTGLLLQMFIVSRILKYFGARIALYILPFIALGGISPHGILPDSEHYILGENRR